MSDIQNYENEYRQIPIFVILNAIIIEIKTKSPCSSYRNIRSILRVFKWNYSENVSEWALDEKIRLKNALNFVCSTSISLYNSDAIFEKLFKYNVLGIIRAITDNRSSVCIQPSCFNFLITNGRNKKLNKIDSHKLVEVNITDINLRWPHLRINFPFIHW